MPEVSVHGEGTPPTLVVTSPYRENAVLAIARAASEIGALGNFYTTLYFGRWTKRANRIPAAGTLLAADLSRRGFPGLPQESIRTAASLTEFAHVGVRKLLGKRAPQLAADMMYRVKVRFDGRVGRQLRKQTGVKALVAMYGAARESFQIVKAEGGLAVLNFVNSHPTEHNRYLAELGKVRAHHHEMIPAKIAKRVDAELALADLVLVPSRFVAEQLISHRIPREKIALLPYGVDLRTFHPSSDRERNRRSLQCLYVGQISYRKGVPILLDAARRCRDLGVRFRLIGPIVSGEILNDLPDNVSYAGSTLPGGVPTAMREADLFVLPSIEDACALVVLEAMATALPVITTTNNGSGEIIEDKKEGLIVPAGDARALASAVRQLVEQPSLRHQLAQAARRKVQDAYSWETYGRSVLSVIENRIRIRPSVISDACASTH